LTSATFFTFPFPQTASGCTSRPFFPPSIGIAVAVLSRVHTINCTENGNFVFGGFTVLRSRFLLSLVIALFLSTLASAVSVPVPVNMTFLHPMGVMDGTIKATTGNWAVWNLFTKGITQNSASLALDSQALLLARHAPASEFRGLVLYTPEGGSPGHGPQEFIGYRFSAMATPEPGSLMLLATRLMGIAGVARRKLRV
jgi:hypothetical protein